MDEFPHPKEFGILRSVLAYLSLRMPAVLRQNEEVLHEIIAVQAANVVAKNSCRARKPGLEFQEASHISVLILSTFHIFSLMQFGQLPDFLAITRRTLRSQWKTGIFHRFSSSILSHIPGISWFKMFNLRRLRRLRILGDAPGHQV